MQNPKYDVIVVGAGPAGLLAAGKAASQGAKVLVLEKMEKPARKLRITGKGRCNITNAKDYRDFFQEIEPNPRFLSKAFGYFFNKDIIQLLHEQGVNTVTERGQRVFPESNKAWEVANAIERWTKSKGVDIQIHSKVTEILAEKGIVVGVKCLLVKENRFRTFNCKSVVLATGGKSYPATGSTGDGYELARNLGHSITELRPALTGIETQPLLAEAKGLMLKNVAAKLYVGETLEAEEFGEVEITECGLDGPSILRISLKAIDAYRAGKNVTICIDLKPALDEIKLNNRILRDIQKTGYFSIDMLLRGLVPQPLVKPIAGFLGVKPQMHASQLTADERKKLVNILKNLRFTMTGYRGWDEAIITAGGIVQIEIDSQTMGSKLIEGLYLAGEIIDVNGNTGGYNLQIAYSTGWLAGKSASEFALRK